MFNRRRFLEDSILAATAALAAVVKPWTDEAGSLWRA